MGPTPEPRYHTERDPSRKSLGPKIGKVSTALGRPFIPWQYRAADVAGELHAPGILVYPLVIITVPRQAGKTALVLATQLHRCLSGPDRRVWYTAQTGIKAREQFVEMIRTVERSPFNQLTDCKRGAGDTRIEVPRLASQMKAHPPTEDSLHGNQSDLNVVDEGWFFDEPTATGLMGAIKPTQLTRRQLTGRTPQTIIVSTMGTAQSTWFHGLVDDARAGQEGVCLIDYGIADDVDSEDIDAVAAAHPGVGHTCTVDDIRDARPGLSAGEFARAYGNRRTRQSERTIDAAAFAATITTTKIPDSARVVFGAAVSYDETEIAIYCAALVGGRPLVELIEVQRFDPDAARERLVALSRTHNAPVVIDPHGPAGVLAARLPVTANVIRVSTDDVAVACPDVLERINRKDDDGKPGPGIRFRPDPFIERAVEVAARKTVGDRWVWSRRGSVGSIAALEASTLAVHGLVHRPAPVKPQIRISQ